MSDKQQPDREMHKQVEVVGMREIEGFIRGLSANPKLPKLTKGEKAILRRVGPKVFLRGFLWTLDNIALRDDPKVGELEEILLGIANGSTETVDTAYNAAVALAVKKGFEIQKERENG